MSLVRKEVAFADATLLSVLSVVLTTVSRKSQAALLLVMKLNYSALYLFTASWFFGRSDSFQYLATTTHYYLAPSLWRPTQLGMTKASVPSTFIEALSEAASKSLGKAMELVSTRGGLPSGGGGASTSTVTDKVTGERFFVKSARSGNEMLRAEYLGVREMSETNTIRVPKPVSYGEHGGRAFVMFEYLEFTNEGRGGQYQLGKQLAQMHRHTSEKGFGFHVDNTIGATPQPNPWVDDWADFWIYNRLDHMLRLTGGAGMKAEKVEQLRQRTRELLSHSPAPSLIHGDLWGGNKGFVRDGDRAVPCIFDPATYYGDREADVAMTYLFGGFTSDFYKGYNDEWPLPPGHEQRVTVYNLYHILNHEVLFGGGYASQARRMIEQILSFK